jgi:CRP-like cAMP-binding protein
VRVEWKLLAGLRAEDSDALLEQARRRRFARGDVVFHEGDPAHALHLVVAGRFAVRVTTPLGDTATLHVVGPGGWFGELAIVSDAPRNATVAALDPGETLALQRAQVDDIRRRDPTVDRVLIGALVAELRRTSTQLLEALYLPADRRVLRRLSDMAKVYATANGATVIPLTQDDIAQLAGTTRPTVNKVLRAAAAGGLVELRRGRIEIRDHDRLIDAAD